MPRPRPAGAIRRRRPEWGRLFRKEHQLMTSTFNDQVREGMDIFDADHEKVGTLAETAQGYLRVSSGFLGLGKEHYIPLSAIREVQGDRIHLNIRRDRLDELGSDPALMEPDGEFDGTQVERIA